MTSHSFFNFSITERWNRFWFFLKERSRSTELMKCSWPQLSWLLLWACRVRSRTIVPCHTYYGNFCKFWQFDNFRYVHWESAITGPCKSDAVRHDVCLLGAEYLSKIATIQSLLGITSIVLKGVLFSANKIWPAADYGAVLCIGELLYNRSSQRVNTIDRLAFSNLPQVREQRAKKENRFDPNNFKCQIEQN